MEILTKMFGDRIICSGLWPLHSSGLNTSDFQSKKNNRWNTHTNEKNEGKISI